VTLIESCADSGVRRLVCVVPEHVIGVAILAEPDPGIAARRRLRGGLPFAPSYRVMVVAEEA